ncbi:Protein of unknown function DUF4817 [Trinorchestia longiramus]|nr:Protein of unknown function DUF4817 [Trinorchestia longiramus]
MQLTKEQRTFIVEKYFQAKIFQQVIQSFQEHFPERQSPTKIIIWKPKEQAWISTKVDQDGKERGDQKKMFELFKEHLQKIRKSLLEKCYSPHHKCWRSSPSPCPCCCCYCWQSPGQNDTRSPPPSSPSGT